MGRTTCPPAHVLLAALLAAAAAKPAPRHLGLGQPPDLPAPAAAAAAAGAAACEKLPFPIFECGEVMCEACLDPVAGTSVATCVEPLSGKVGSAMGGDNATATLFRAAIALSVELDVAPGRADCTCKTEVRAWSRCPELPAT